MRRKRGRDCYQFVTKRLGRGRLPFTTMSGSFWVILAAMAWGEMLRFLTFICFFNFSGLNNGYIYFADAGPLCPTQSVHLVGALLHQFSQPFSSGITNPIDSAHKAITYL